MVGNVSLNLPAAIENLNCTGVELTLQDCQLPLTTGFSCTNPFNTVSVECIFGGRST